MPQSPSQATKASQGLCRVTPDFGEMPWPEIGTKSSFSAQLQCFYHPWWVFGAGREGAGWGRPVGAEGDAPARICPRARAPLLRSPLAHKGLFTGGKEGKAPSMAGNIHKYPPASQIDGADPGYGTCPQLWANGVGKEFTRLGSSCLPFISGF